MTLSFNADSTANFHIHPQMNLSDPPTTVHFADREQGHALWGKLDGSVVHTALEMKHPSAAGSRAQSISTTCSSEDRHAGEVIAISPSKTAGGILRFVSAGSDGLIKYWEFTPAPHKSIRKANGTVNEASIACLFTSELVEPLEHRSDEVKRRRTGAPDPFLLVRVDAAMGVICGVTEDGDLRVWWSLDDQVQEARLDIGSIDDLGPIKSLELEVRDGTEGPDISVLVMHYRGTTFERYDVKVDIDGEYETAQRTYVTPLKTPLTAIKPLLEPTPPISEQSKQVRPSLLSPLVEDDSDDASDHSSPILAPQSDMIPFTKTSEFGRFVIAGDADGSAWIWAWDSEGSEITPIRGWAVMERKITAVDYHCGVVAIGG